MEDDRREMLGKLTRQGAEPSVPPNGRPATLLSSSGVAEGPPSVS